MRAAVGGVFSSSVKLRSLMTWTITGMMLPAWAAVRALYSLTKKAIFAPKAPKAGPTGGAGVALPAGRLSLTEPISVNAFMEVRAARRRAILPAANAVAMPRPKATVVAPVAACCAPALGIVCPRRPRPFEKEPAPSKTGACTKDGLLRPAIRRHVAAAANIAAEDANSTRRLEACASAGAARAADMAASRCRERKGARAAGLGAWGTVA
mmetsp:Transcript_80317/g.181244  ORF Transcript_80317/g.181244 Transcript_80317/m.181244 type:complete len:210 (+) Transcript_80317:298-927(+)